MSLTVTCIQTETVILSEDEGSEASVLVPFFAWMDPTEEK